VLKQNAAFAGMEVSAHYQYFVVPGVIVYDLRELSVKQTPIDVHTAFLEFAKKVKDKRFSRVELSYRGTTKFQIDGASFQKLGVEYTKRNFDYVLYTFPQLFRSKNTVKPADGKSERDALIEFHRRWYGQDQLTTTVANSAVGR
jgi:curved DNA-binding protein CbpA